MNKFIPPHPLKTAVLFLVFNRLDTTKQVFEAIRKAKPPKLYIAADGARENKKGEKEVVEEVRKYVLDNIDWDCEVKTLFRKRNLGCKMAVSSAITWFFENEEQGIILEDDCLPSQSFFWYCEELLNKYKDDMRIWHIGGSNFKEKHNIDFDYFYSRFAQVWGWATWRSRWKYYDADLKRYEKFLTSPIIKYFFPDNLSYTLRKDTFSQGAKGIVDTWDYQWHFTVFINNGLCIVPKVNLVTNIGAIGIHANKKGSSHFMKRYEYFNLENNNCFIPNLDYEEFIYHGNINLYAKIKVLIKMIKEGI